MPPSSSASSCVPAAPDADTQEEPLEQGSRAKSVKVATVVPSEENL